MKITVYTNGRSRNLKMREGGQGAVEFLGSGDYIDGGGGGPRGGSPESAFVQ